MKNCLNTSAHKRRQKDPGSRFIGLFRTLNLPQGKNSWVVVCYYLAGWVCSCAISEIICPLEVKDMGYVQSNICASATYMLLTLCSFFDHLCKCLSIASHSTHIKTEFMSPPLPSPKHCEVTDSICLSKQDYWLVSGVVNANICCS